MGRRLVLVFLAMLLGVSLAAQQATKKDDKQAQAKSKAAETNAASAMPNPSDEITRLAKALSGRWKVSGKILDESWAPGGSDGVGNEIIHRGPGGFSVLMNSQMAFTKMGGFEGHGVIYWDAKKNSFQGIWCDNWGPTCEPIGEGKWEGTDRVVFTGTMTMGNQQIPTRQTYSNLSATGFDWSMDAGDGKGGWKPEMALKYVRASAGAGGAAKQ